MDRRTTLDTSERASVVPVAAEAAWLVVASGRGGPQWYVDAAPLVFRGAVDRLVGGSGSRRGTPGTALLGPGDPAGFWRVAEAGPAGPGWRLTLEAEVRAPGQVVLSTTVTPDGPGRCELHQAITFVPSGLLGRAYRTADLPAREAVLELVHRRLLADLQPGRAS